VAMRRPVKRSHAVFYSDVSGGKQSATLRTWAEELGMPDAAARRKKPRMPR